MFVALAPVLFDRVPRNLLILTILFPFIAYWLIWGGSLWVSIFALVGVVVGFYAFKALSEKSFFGAIVAGLFAALIFWIFILPSLVSLATCSPSL